MAGNTLDKLVEFRHDLHRHPELGFHEHDTARKVSVQLDALGVEYQTGFGGTGIVARIDGAAGPGDASVGLRAELDAVPIHKHSGVAYASENPGCMHACGHDGHTSLLLGAAERLIRDNAFMGRVYLIFQPAEECVGGATAMIDDGVFERFPMHELFALHSGDLAGFNVIPDTARLCGTIRALDDETRETVRASLRRLCESLEHWYGASIELAIEDKFSVTINAPGATATARDAIAGAFGDAALAPNHKPCMGGEDFSHKLEVRPGAYIHVGSGDAEHTRGLHHPEYDFNDAIMASGIELFVRLAHALLEKQARGAKRRVS